MPIFPPVNDNMILDVSSTHVFSLLKQLLSKFSGKAIITQDHIF